MSVVYVAKVAVENSPIGVTWEHVLTSGESGTSVQEELEGHGYKVIQVEIFDSEWLIENHGGSCTLIGN